MLGRRARRLPGRGERAGRRPSSGPRDACAGALALSGTHSTECRDLQTRRPTGLDRVSLSQGQTAVKRAPAPRPTTATQAQTGSVALQQLEDRQKREQQPPDRRLAARRVTSTAARVTVQCVAHTPPESSARRESAKRPFARSWRPIWRSTPSTSFHNRCAPTSSSFPQRRAGTSASRTGVAVSGTRHSNEPASRGAPSTRCATRSQRSPLPQACRSTSSAARWATRIPHDAPVLRPLHPRARGAPPRDAQRRLESDDPH